MKNSEELRKFLKEEINPNLIQELRSLKIDLSLLWGLIMAEEGNNIPSYLSKVLKRRNWLNEEGKTTAWGRQIAAELLRSNEIEGKVQESISSKLKKEIKSEADALFMQWWESFPATNTVGRFIGTQSKRMKQLECKERFNVLSKIYPPQEIILATKYHMNLVRLESIKKGESQLTYIPNSYRYLKEEVFAPFINSAKQAENNEGDSSSDPLGGTGTFNNIELGL